MYENAHLIEKQRLMDVCALIDVDEAKKIVRIKIMWIMCNLPRLEVIPNRVLQIMKIFWNQGVCQDREIK